MDCGALQRIVRGFVHAIRHEHGAAWNQDAAEPFGEDDDIGFDLVVMRGEEAACAVHAGLHFIEHEQRAVAGAKRVGFFKIIGIRQANAGFGLDGLDEERRELPGRQLPGDSG